MTDKLTDSEIVKALECCLETSGVNCGKCPYCDNCVTDENTSLMMTDALNLINRLQAENERLEKEAFTYKIRWAKSEVRENKAKAEAYKECIEKVKAFYRENRFAYEAESLCEELDDILKELVGENGYRTFNKNSCS